MQTRIPTLATTLAHELAEYAPKIGRSNLFRFSRHTNHIEQRRLQTLAGAWILDKLQNGEMSEEMGKKLLCALANSISGSQQMGIKSQLKSLYSKLAAPTYRTSNPSEFQLKISNLLRQHQELGNNVVNNQTAKTQLGLLAQLATIELDDGIDENKQLEEFVQFIDQAGSTNAPIIGSENAAVVSIQTALQDHRFEQGINLSSLQKMTLDGEKPKFLIHELVEGAFTPYQATRLATQLSRSPEAETIIKTYLANPAHLNKLFEIGKREVAVSMVSALRSTPTSAIAISAIREAAKITGEVTRDEAAIISVLSSVVEILSVASEQETSSAFNTASLEAIQQFLKGLALHIASSAEQIAAFKEPLKAIEADIAELQIQKDNKLAEALDLVSDKIATNPSRFPGLFKWVGADEIRLDNHTRNPNLFLTAFYQRLTIAERATFDAALAAKGLTLMPEHGQFRLAYPTDLMTEENLSRERAAGIVRTALIHYRRNKEKIVDLKECSNALKAAVAEAAAKYYQLQLGKGKSTDKALALTNEKFFGYCQLDQHGKAVFALQNTVKRNDREKITRASYSDAEHSGIWTAEATIPRLWADLARNRQNLLAPLVASVGVRTGSDSEAILQAVLSEGVKASDDAVLFTFNPESKQLTRTYNAGPKYRQFHDTVISFRMGTPTEAELAAARERADGALRTLGTSPSDLFIPELDVEQEARLAATMTAQDPTAEPVVSPVLVSRDNIATPEAESPLASSRHHASTDSIATDPREADSHGTHTPILTDASAAGSISDAIKNKIVIAVSQYYDKKYRENGNNAAKALKETQARWEGICRVNSHNDITVLTAFPTGKENQALGGIFAKLRSWNIFKRFTTAEQTLSEAFAAGIVIDGKVVMTFDPSTRQLKSTSTANSPTERTPLLAGYGAALTPVGSSHHPASPAPARPRSATLFTPVEVPMDNTADLPAVKTVAATGKPGNPFATMPTGAGNPFAPSTNPFADMTHNPRAMKPSNSSSGAGNPFVSENKGTPESIRRANWYRMAATGTEPAV